MPARVVAHQERVPLVARQVRPARSVAQRVPSVVAGQQVVPVRSDAAQPPVAEVPSVAQRVLRVPSAEAPPVRAAVRSERRAIRRAAHPVLVVVVVAVPLAAVPRREGAVSVPGARVSVLPVVDVVPSVPVVRPGSAVAHPVSGGAVAAVRLAGGRRSGGAVVVRPPVARRSAVAVVAVSVAVADAKPGQEPIKDTYERTGFSHGRQLGYDHAV